MQHTEKAQIPISNLDDTGKRRKTMETEKGGKKKKAESGSQNTSESISPGV